MVSNNELKIGPPQNEEFLKVWNEINELIERLNELTKAVPTIVSLKSNNEIDQSQELGKVSKEVKEFETRLMSFLESAHDFRGNPVLKFKKDVDLKLSTWHYLNLLHSRIEYLERSYFQIENQIQRTEDFIHKHNSNLKTDRSLSYGRKSIWFGFAGIIFGIVGSSFSLIGTIDNLPHSIIKKETESNIRVMDSTMVNDNKLNTELDTISVNSDSTLLE